MKIAEFESNLQKRYMEVRFPNPVDLEKGMVAHLRTQWLQELKVWHTPYKALIDCTNLQVQEDAKAAMDQLFQMLASLHMIRACGWGESKGASFGGLPFDVFSTREEALSALGVREQRRKKGDASFRELITIENHFRQKTVEVSFESPCEISEKGQVDVLKSKITNNLAQWHSSWNLLFDCNNLVISTEVHGEWEKMLVFFRGFFLLECLGYGNPKASSYPFKVHRNRHRALLAIDESEDDHDGETANCSSRRER